jgi:hypothetical protein
VHFVGLLTTYQYYNMDQVVAQALVLSAKLSGRPHARLDVRPPALNSSQVKGVEVASAKREPIKALGT